MVAKWLGSRTRDNVSRVQAFVPLKTCHVEGLKHVLVFFLAGCSNSEKGCQIRCHPRRLIKVHNYEVPRVPLCGRDSLVVKVSDHGWHVTSSSPVPLKTCRVEESCMLNPSRA
ncbi:hypothetical protein TNCV_4847411 [Trichonephila clavipes]|nr:hypothetical protein TNCV_4847411 [Trichonephila clavipes]